MRAKAEKSRTRENRGTDRFNKSSLENPKNRLFLALGTGLVAAIVVALAVLAWQEMQLWYMQVRQPRHLLAVAQRSSFRTALAYREMGNILAGRGELDQAVKSYQQALKIKPDFVEAHYDLGNALAAKGDINEAIENYQAALSLSPDFVEARQALREALATLGR